jgi:hypothetical protein
MAKKNRIKIESTTLLGEDVTVYLQLPDAKENKQAQLVYNKAFREALQSGAILRQKLAQVMEEQGVWDEVKQKQYDETLDAINESERKLDRGGISLSEARDIALDMQMKRVEFRELISERSSMDSNTAEGLADNERFSHLVFACLYNQSGELYFSSKEEYEENANEPFVVKTAGELAQKLYGLDPDYEKNLPENKFLQDYNLSDDNLNLINKDGHLIDIDEDGVERLIDENGRFIKYNEDGESYFVNRDGEEVTLDGSLFQKFTPFLDDSGKPIPVPGEEEEEEEEEVAEAKKEEKPKRTPRKRTAKKAEPKATTE